MHFIQGALGTLAWSRMGRRVQHHSGKGKKENKTQTTGAPYCGHEEEEGLDGKGNTGTRVPLKA